MNPAYTAHFPVQDFSHILHVHVFRMGVLFKASGRSREKSQISRDFQGQIREKNGRFRGNFAGIFEASFAEKRLVKNGRFLWDLPEQISLESDWFCAKFSMKLDALIACTQASYRNMKLYFTSKLIEHNKTNKRIRILKTHLVIYCSSCFVEYLLYPIACCLPHL